MTKVLVLGANGQLARNTIPCLLQNPDIALTLYVRRAQRLRNPDPDRVAIVEGDVLNSKTLRTAMQGHGQMVVHEDVPESSQPLPIDRQLRGP